MKYGLIIFLTVDAIRVTDLARAAEELGFDLLLLPEHTHIPVARQSERHGLAPMPPEYPRIVAPFVSLGAAAAVTSRIKIGTGICLVAEHDPIILAKEVATLDHLSGGRFVFGVGGGWNAEEARNHGTDPTKRWSVMRERVLAMKRIWAEDEAAYHGEFVNFGPIWSWPKPLQKPHPPILVGGTGPHALQRVLEYGDEWMPSAGLTHETRPVRIAELQRLAAEAGRDPIPVTQFWAEPTLKDLEHYQFAGVVRCVFQLPSNGRDAALRRIEELAELGRAFDRAGGS
ncbi:MAG: LLM class F420-dependent oxidoreductase [Gemmataceae bacterium]|nr:LLM class F420-dependent oxidoreductase [Gemmataceae bacterium]